MWNKGNPMFLRSYVSILKECLLQSLTPNFTIIAWYSEKGIKCSIILMAFHSEFSLTMLSLFEMQSQFSKSVYSSVDLPLLSKEFCFFSSHWDRPKDSQPLWGPFIWNSLKSLHVCQFVHAL